MSKRLFVGNLAFQTTDGDLRGTFEEFGPIVDAKVVTDRDTGRSRGFGFIEMSTEDDARKAVEALNGATLDGRALRVAEAEERRGPSPGGFSGGARRSGGSGNRW